MVIVMQGAVRFTADPASATINTSRENFFNLFRAISVQVGITVAPVSWKIKGNAPLSASDCSRSLNFVASVLKDLERFGRKGAYRP